MLSGELERRRRRPRTGDAHSKGVRVEAIGLDTCSQSILVDFCSGLGAELGSDAEAIVI